MRIVLDTNILISALFFGGKPKTILDYIVDGKIIAFVSREIIEEYKEVVDRINILKNGSISIDLLLNLFTLINVVSDIKICRDKDDDKFINCAIDSKSLYVVSGDNDLLVIKRYKDITIISADDFLKQLNIYVMN